MIDNWDGPRRNGSRIFQQVAGMTIQIRRLGQTPSVPGQTRGQTPSLRRGCRFRRPPVLIQATISRRSIPAKPEQVSA